MGKDSDLCRDVKAVRADGSNVSAQLMLAIESLKMASLDDAINEGPHAAARKVSERATNASWAWAASSLRLQQNLWDFDNILPLTDEDPEML